MAITERLAAARRPVALSTPASARPAWRIVAAALAGSGHPVGGHRGRGRRHDRPAGPGYLGVYPAGFGHRSAIEVDDADLFIRLGVRRVKAPLPGPSRACRPALIDISEAGTSRRP